MRTGFIFIITAAITKFKKKRKLIRNSATIIYQYLKKKKKSGDTVQSSD